MKLLVCGTETLIGTACANKLRESGHEVVSFESAESVMTTAPLEEALLEADSVIVIMRERCDACVTLINCVSSASIRLIF